MSTMEHLFMQIFERKGWIEDQLRQQMESYAQSMAYNLIADGGRIPSWIWTTGSDAVARPDTKEWNREQLISGILLPPSWTATPSANNNTLFTLPTLKGDHVSLMVKAMPNSDHNDNERDPDMTIESEVESCAEIDPSVRIQRSRSRQKDLEIHPNKKAKRSNHLGEGIIINEHTGRMTRSRATLAKADCVKKSSNSSIVPDEDGGRVTRSRFTAQKHDQDSQLGPMNDVAPPKCTTGTSAMELVSDAARSIHSGLKMTHVVASELPALPLIEPKKLLFYGIQECGLNEKSAFDFEKENRVYSPDTLTKLEAVQSVKEDCSRDSKKENSSLARRKLQEDALHISERIHRAEEANRISNGGPEEEERVQLLEVEDSHCMVVEDSECDSQKDPEESFFDVGVNNLETVQSMREELFCRGAITAHVSPENGRLQAEDVSLTAEVMCREEVKVSGGCHEEGVSSNSRPSQLPAMSSANVISRSSENARNNSSIVGNCMLSPVSNFSGHCTVLEGTNKKCSLGSLIKEPGDSPVQLNTCHHDSSAIFSETNKVLFEAQEANAASIEVGKRSASQHSTTPDAAETHTVMQEYQHLSRNPVKSGERLSGRGTVVEDVEANCILLETDVNEIYVGSKDVAEKNAGRQTMPANSTEILNTPPKARYFLRSLSGRDRNAVSSKSNENDDARGAIPIMGGAARACEISWPKRNKVGVRSSNIFATSPRLRLEPLRCIQDGSGHRCKTTSEIASGPVMVHQPFPLMSGMGTDISNEVSRSSLKTLHQSKKQSILESGPYLKGKDQAVVTSLATEHTPEVSYPDLALESSRSCLKDEVKATEFTILELKPQCSPKDKRGLLHTENTECEIPNFSRYYEELIKEREICDGEKSSTANYTSGTSHYHDDLFVYDEIMPEFEGFSIGVPSPMDDDILINGPDLPRLMEEQVSMLDHLCRSRTMPTPGSRPSIKYKINKIPDVYLSLPAGLLEHMSLRNSFQFSDTDMKQLRASENGWLTSLRCNLGSDFDGSFLEGAACPHSMPSSSSRSEWEARKPPLTPPVEKFGQRMVSGRRSVATSEKVGSNPELTCFRIDEDSSSTEGNGHLDELGTSEEMAGSRRMKFSTSRKALADVTASYRNSPNLVCESEKFVERGSLDSVNTESSFGTHMGLGNGYPRNRKTKLEAKENHALSVSGKRVPKAAGSLRNRSSKQEMSVKANERNQSQGNLVKGCKPSNIVSNLSSFIPLVRQKQQEAAPMKGKKEIKVKALEAAETAKRLEEKKQNEREMRKAAVKLERDRLEQEHAKRLELTRKQKEVEKRKKDADIAARKRQREEEEERKGKGRKRRCTEEVRKHQRTQEERLHPMEAEKEAKWKLKPENGIAGCQKVADAEVVPEDVNHCTNSLEANYASKTSNDAEKVVSNLDGLQEAKQDGKSIAKESQDLLSYEMSPFMDSDDEDGEEESRRKKKFIPSWARKECINQFILSKKDLDPLEIFHRKPSFDLNEVLPHTRRRLL